LLVPDPFLFPLQDYAPLVIRNSTFTDNNVAVSTQSGSASFGGSAILITQLGNDPIKISDCKFIRNTASYLNPNLKGYLITGAVSISSGNRSTVDIDGSLFVQNGGFAALDDTVSNRTIAAGGAVAIGCVTGVRAFLSRMFSTDGELLIVSLVQTSPSFPDDPCGPVASISNCIFDLNRGSFGGALGATLARVKVRNSLFRNNIATFLGAAISVFGDLSIERWPTLPPTLIPIGLFTTIVYYSTKYSAK
jgi:hypothetical protein